MLKIIIITFVGVIFSACGTSSDPAIDETVNTSETNATISYSWDDFSIQENYSSNFLFDDNSSLSFASWAIGGSDTMFTSDNLNFNNGVMELNLISDSSYDGYSTTGAEARTSPEYGYGRYEIVMKPALSDGYVNSFFLFWDNSDLDTSWNEIDIEFIKADNQLQLNYWDKPGSSHEKLITLDFNASSTFHTYTIEYMPTYIKWYVDNTIVHTVTQNLPATQKFKIMMNIWKPVVDSSGNSWAGTPDDSLLPISSSYDELNYYKIDTDTNSNPHNCQEAPSLESWALCSKEFIPDENSSLYEQPSSTVKTAFLDTVSAMLEGDCTQTLDDSLKENYSLFTLQDSDTNDTYCILSEVVDSDSNGKIDKGWGSVIVNTDSSSRLALQIPHPLFDAETLLEGVITFKHTQAKVLLIAGAHRNASVVDSACQSSYKLSDVAHDDTTSFFYANKAIKTYFEQNGSDFSVVQLHGKSDTSCSDTDAFLSNGVDDNSTKIDDLVTLIQDHYQYATPSSPKTNDCSLTGETNIEGRWLNDVTNVCSTSSSVDTLHFIHIEQDRSLRDGLYWVPILNTLN